MTKARDLAQAPNQSFSFKNRIINGDMRIDQRNAGASVTPTTTGGFSADRWQLGLTQASKFSIQQSTTAPTGFSNSLLVTSLSAYSVGSGDTFFINQSIEGFNTADLMFGTSNAATVTISFWVRSSLTGTFGGVLGNAGSDYRYPFTYTISSANTWEQKSITISGATAGTWIGATNGRGMRVIFNLGSGSAYSGTANTWGSGEAYAPTGATSVVGTNGATFYITGVQLEKGSTATSFDYRPYGTELALCQRYCQVLSGGGNMRYFIAGNAGGTFAFPTYFHKTTMRAAPTLSVSSPSHFTFETWASAQQVVSTIGLNVPNTDSTTVTITVPSSLATGGNVFANSSSAQAIFSAEL